MHDLSHIDLHHVYVLVTRPQPQADELCQPIIAHGGQALCFPTIAFAPPPCLAAFEQALSQLAEQDWLIFISPQAVYSSVVAIRKQWSQLPETVKFAAIGAGTARALREAGYNVNVQPKQSQPMEWNSQGLLDLPEFQDIAGKKIAIVRGLGGREILDKILAERGGHILPLLTYQRVLPDLPKADISHCLSLLKQRMINRIVCTSYEGVKNLKLLLGEAAWPYLQGLPLIVVSERIKILAQDLGFQTIWVSHNPSSSAILEVLAQDK
jgi:uroporphyrinogen-III synthase